MGNASKPFDPGAARLLGLKAASAMVPLKLLQLDASGMLVRPDRIELFNIVRFNAKGATRLAQLERSFVNMGEIIERTLALHGQHARVLGCADGGEVRSRLLVFFANFGIKAQRQLDFDHSIRGYRSNIAGEIMEWLVEASGGLRADILRWAQSARGDLNDTVAALRFISASQIAKRPARIVNAHNQTVEFLTKGAFDEPVHATNTFLCMPDGKKRKYVDALTVSFFRGPDGKILFVAPTTMGQYKFNTAIRKAAKQTDEDPARLKDAAELVFSAGGIEYAFKPEQVVFMAGKKRPEMSQYVVTHSDAFVRELGRKEIYADDPGQLLGAPQVTPIVGRGGNVHAVLVELAVDSRFILDLVDAVVRLQPPGP